VWREIEWLTGGSCPPSRHTQINGISYSRRGPFYEFPECDSVSFGHYFVKYHFSVNMDTVVHTIDYVELRESLLRNFSQRHHMYGYAPRTYDVDSFTEDVRIIVASRTGAKRVEQHAQLVVDQLLASFKVALDTHECKILSLPQTRDVVMSGMASAIATYPAGWRTETQVRKCPVHVDELRRDDCAVHVFAHYRDCMEVELRMATFLCGEEGKEQRYITLDDIKRVVTHTTESHMLPLTSLQTSILHGANDEHIRRCIFSSLDPATVSASSCILLDQVYAIMSQVWKDAERLRAPLWNCYGGKHEGKMPDVDCYFDTIKKLLGEIAQPDSSDVPCVTMAHIDSIFWETFMEVVNPHHPEHSDRRFAALASHILRYYYRSMSSRAVDGAVPVSAAVRWVDIQRGATFEPSPRCVFETVVYDKCMSRMNYPPCSFRHKLAECKFGAKTPQSAYMPEALREQIMSDVMEYCLMDDGSGDVHTKTATAWALYRTSAHYDVLSSVADEKHVYTCKRKRAVQECHVCDKHIEPSDRRATRIEWRYGSDHYVCAKPCLDKYVTHDCCTGLSAHAGAYDDVRDDPLLPGRAYIVKKVSQ